jgi:hypothetical protein
MFSFTPGRFNPGIELPVSIDRRLVKPLGQFGHCGEEKKYPFTAPAGNPTPVVQPVA